MDDENGGPLDPSSIGEFELIKQLRGPYGFCDEPTDIECALNDDAHTPHTQTGQVSLTCNLDKGFLCFHSQQSGDCFNYAIRVLCNAPCPTPTPQVEDMTSGFPSEDTASELASACPKWTKWYESESVGYLGEVVNTTQLRDLCSEPTGIECRLAEEPHTPYNETGQVGLECSLEQGFMCLNSQQDGDCSKYAVRLRCPALCVSGSPPTSKDYEADFISILSAVIEKKQTDRQAGRQTDRQDRQNT
ncbi:mucin-5AC-like [Ptychodera flava]|uniref:mucin-5AC-like n=1 Tax=Ptychodera flava TaxID=63121 RepID=UPI00396A5BF5